MARSYGRNQAAASLDSPVLGRMGAPDPRDWRGNDDVHCEPRARLPCAERRPRCEPGIVGGDDNRDGRMGLVGVAFDARNHDRLGCEPRRPCGGVARRRVEPARPLALTEGRRGLDEY